MMNILSQLGNLENALSALKEALNEHLALERSLQCQIETLEQDNHSLTLELERLRDENIELRNRCNMFADHVINSEPSDLQDELAKKQDLIDKLKQENITLMSEIGWLEDENKKLKEKQLFNVCKLKDSSRKNPKAENKKNIKSQYYRHGAITFIEPFTCSYCEGKFNADGYRINGTKYIVCRQCINSFEPKHPKAKLKPTNIHN